ncbi:MAG TPA: DUF4260 domain-containing protein [Virgibacillus sp.]|nr:DUF4260 domain-containing protein [Virgibacillus sp.]
MNKAILYGEGLAVFVFCLYVYNSFQFSWILFLLLLFAPDLSIFGYLFNPKSGAIIYNLVHTYMVSIGVVALGLWLSYDLLIAIGIILTAHIGMDRMVGYGLKYSTHFKHNHLKRV